jgi:hypothetical protein
MNQKWAIRSKTIVGALVAFLIAVGPQFGITFGTDEAAIVNEFVDSLIAFLALALTYTGRRDARDDITLLPSSGSNQRGFIRIRHAFLIVFVSFFVLAIVAACQTKPETARQSLLYNSIQIEQSANTVEQLRESGTIDMAQALDAGSALQRALDYNTTAAQLFCVEINSRPVIENCVADPQNANEKLSRARSSLSFVRNLLEQYE